MESDFCYVIGIGASAGGQEALKDFLRNLPDTPNAAFIIVTHLSKTYKTNLHTILAGFSPIPVSLITNGEPIKRNHVYVMPENVTLVVHANTMLLEPRDRSAINHAIDHFFVTLAEDRREKAVGIILSGSGTDGALGVKKISELGGKVFVQEPASSAFGSMPNAAINSDHPIAVETPGHLAKVFLHYLDNCVKLI